MYACKSSLMLDTTGTLTDKFLSFKWSALLLLREVKFSNLVPTGVAVVMHLLIWFIKSGIQNAVSASLIGVLYGPIFPACLSMANDILPEEVHMVAMALMYVPLYL